MNLLEAMSKTSGSRRDRRKKRRRGRKRCEEEDDDESRTAAGCPRPVQITDRYVTSPDLSCLGFDDNGDGFVGGSYDGDLFLWSI